MDSEAFISKYSPRTSFATLRKIFRESHTSTCSILFDTCSNNSMLRILKPSNAGFPELAIDKTSIPNHHKDTIFLPLRHIDESVNYPKLIKPSFGMLLLEYTPFESF